MYEMYLTNAMVGIINAKQALSNYSVTGIKNLKNTSAYNIQQTFEYLLKYSLYNCFEYNMGHAEEEIKQIFTHNLDQLTIACEKYGLTIPEALKQNAILYSSWEAESRYDVGFSVRTDSLKKAVACAEKWLVEIKPIYKTKLDQVNKKLGL